jgi:hypothetical protein
LLIVSGWLVISAGLGEDAQGTAEDETGETGVDAISIDFRLIHWSPVVNSPVAAQP